MSETTGQHKLVGNCAVLVPLFTDMLVPSCNQALSLLQESQAIKVERGCQVGYEKGSHWNGLWFPRDNRIPFSVHRLPGSWQPRHLTHLGTVGFFSVVATGVAAEHLKVPIPGVLGTEWQQSSQIYIYRKSWMKGWVRSWGNSGLTGMPQKGQKPKTSHGVRMSWLSHQSQEHSIFL